MPEVRTILAIDDTAQNLGLLEALLEGEGYRVLVATDGQTGLEVAKRQRPDIILLDVMMPGWDGFQTADHLRRVGFLRDIPILFLSALDDVASKVRALEAGGVDFVTKPFQRPELLARIRNHLELSTLRNRLQQQVAEKTRALERSRENILHILSIASEYRDYETGMHNNRIGVYAHLFAGLVDCSESQRELILHTAPLHDVGKIGIPDAILHKPGRFEPHEWQIMRGHAEIGARILRTFADGNPLLRMAAEIAEGHHEAWDGSGYPHGRAGTAIPLAARITSLCDVYDALRSERPYKAGLSHRQALKVIFEGDARTRPEHFDPELLRVLERHHPSLDRIFRQLATASALSLPELVRQVQL